MATHFPPKKNGAPVWKYLHYGIFRGKGKRWKNRFSVTILSDDIYIENA
jgi:hypothetical protein